MPDHSWTQPESAANTDYQPVYPYNNIQQTEAGHKFEMDDTPGRERVRLEHRSGTFTEIQPNGDVVHKIIGTGYEIIASDKNVMISGVCNITIQGNSILHVQGDSFQQVDGSVTQQVAGSVNQHIIGSCEQTVEGNLDINSSGNINLNAPNVVVNGKLTVDGDIGVTQSIAAEGNISAGLSLSADKSVETPGYVTAGTTVAAGISVYGPIVSDIYSSMEMFRLKVDQHYHIGNLGHPTSPPTSPMEI